MKQTDIPAAVRRHAIPRHLATRAFRLAIRCVLLLLAANAVFLAVRLADNLIPKAAVAASLRAGYADGSMTAASYSSDIRLGVDQYSDCIAAQLAVLGGADIVSNAVAPRLLSPEQIGADGRLVAQYPCRTLKRYVEAQHPETPSATYTRFWQGSASVLAVGLAIMPVQAYRVLLLLTALGLIVLTAVLAARASRRLLYALAPLLLVSALFGGQLSYGQLFSYGPPQIAVWTFAAAMIRFRHALSHDRLVMLAILCGATEAFLDQVISVPLIAGIFLIVAGLVSQTRDGTPSARKAAMNMAVLAAAWLFGFAGTYAMKLLLSVALLGWGPVLEFLQQLAFRAGTVDPEYGYHAEQQTSRFVMLWDNMLALSRNFWRLGVTGSATGIVNYAALLLGLGGWAAALLRRARGPLADRDRALAAGIPYIAAAALFLVWVIAFPEHTMRHAFFMVRSAIVWLIGGWGWLYSAYPPVPKQVDPRVIAG